MEQNMEENYCYDHEPTGVRMCIQVSLKDEGKPANEDSLNLDFWAYNDGFWQRHPGVQFKQAHRNAAIKHFLEKFDKKQ